MPLDKAKDLINGLAFSQTLLPAKTPWAHVTIVLDQSKEPCSDARDYTALQGRIFRAMRDFLQAQGIPFHLLWVREIGPRDGRQHTHCLVPLPPELAGDLAAVIRRAGKLHDLPNNRAVDVNPNRKHGGKGMIARGSFAGVMRDWLKSLSSRATINGIPVMAALKVDDRGQRHPPILGKRSGMSESLGWKARQAAGWRELETPPELLQALPTGEEARRERDRTRKRDKRAQGGLRRALGQAPVRRHTPKPQSLPASSWDLAADFFDDD